MRGSQPECARLRRGLRCAMLAIASWAGVATAGAIDLVKLRPTSLDTCDRLVRQHPNALEAYRCYYQVALATKGLEAAVRRLESILERRPRDHRARLFLGFIDVHRAKRRAGRLLRTAAKGLHETREYRGEVLARGLLAERLIRRARHREALAQLALAQRAASAAGDPVSQAMVTKWRADQALLSYDLSKAMALARRADETLPSGADPVVRDRILWLLSNVHYMLGNYRKAFEAMRRRASIVGRPAQTYVDAQANLWQALVATRLLAMGAMSEAEWLRLRREALAAARKAGNALAEANARLYLFAQRLSDPAAVLSELDKVTALGRRVSGYDGTGEALRLRAKALCALKPASAEACFRLLQEAEAWTRSRGVPWRLASVLVDRVYLRWKLGPPARAWRESLEALEAVERLREMQAAKGVGIRVGARWSHAYYLVSHRLLALGQRAEVDHAGVPTGEAAVAAAFAVMERQRARALREGLILARTLPRRAPSARRAELYRRISQVQKRLLSRVLEATERRRLLSRLSALEAEILELPRIQGATPARVPVPTLAEVRRALPNDTALIVFQVPPWVFERRLLEGVQPWLFSVSRERVRVHRLPDAQWMQLAVSALVGLLDRRDGTEASASHRLHRKLLASALRELPKRVKRLVIVPDGPLHRLPFAVLRAANGAPALAQRFRISHAPSVGLWLSWRRRLARVPPTVLALSDPAIPGADAISRLRDAAPWFEGLRLGRLPHGRREAREAVGALGGASRMVSGAEATERFLKSVDLSRFGVLHLAAHAVVDGSVPERSAVVLAAGDPGEDGLLQVREVAELALQDRVVVLSACRSSSGTVLGGEGVMSLARAFLAAGARAVVGSLWRIRDDDAAELMVEFYRALATGMPVADALAEAQRRRIERGAPAAAWAGLVVLGDGSLAPARPAMRRGGVPIAWVIAAALVAFGVLLLGLWRRRRIGTNV